MGNRDSCRKRKRLGAFVITLNVALAAEAIFAFLHLTRWVIRGDSEREESRKVIVVDAAAMVGMAALITSVSALVWSVRRKA
jgi:uncharacterized membrane protein YidH (DUF202 family)